MTRKTRDSLENPCIQPKNVNPIMSANVRKYADRYWNGLDIWTGKPLEGRDIVDHLNNALCREKTIEYYKSIGRSRLVRHDVATMVDLSEV